MTTQRDPEKVMVGGWLAPEVVELFDQIGRETGARSKTDNLIQLIIEAAEARGMDTAHINCRRTPRIIGAMV